VFVEIRADSGARWKMVSMHFKTAFAQTTEGNPGDNARAAARKIGGELAGIKPAFVVFFASTEYDADTIAAEMHKAFPGARTMGCSTAGEACDGQMLNSSVVAMAFAAEASAYLETAIVLADPEAARKENAPGVFSDATAALEYLGRNLGIPLIQLDYREYFGFMLGATITEFSESVIERTGEMTNAFFVGGIAGDDRKFADLQYVFFNGKAYKNGATVIALLKPANGFEILKTQAVEPMDKQQYTITRADEKTRVIWELDGRDAVSVYTKAIGAPMGALTMRDFDSNPFALMVGGEPYLRAIVETVDGKGIRVLSTVREKTPLAITEAGNILETTRTALAAQIAETGQPAAILHINCVSRHTTLQNEKQVDEFGRLFSGVPHISFASYSEIYVGIVAMTSVMVLFK
jgi:hypothetical protein